MKKTSQLKIEGYVILKNGALTQAVKRSNRLTVEAATKAKQATLFDTRRSANNTVRNARRIHSEQELFGSTDTYKVVPLYGMRPPRVFRLKDALAGVIGAHTKKMGKKMKPADLQLLTAAAQLLEEWK